MGWGRVGRVVPPTPFGVLTSPTADDELSLTGLDHELVLNRRGLAAAPNTREGKYSGFPGGSHHKGEREGVWGTVSGPEEASLTGTGEVRSAPGRSKKLGRLGNGVWVEESRAREMRGEPRDPK